MKHGLKLKHYEGIIREFDKARIFGEVSPEGYIKIVQVESTLHSKAKDKGFKNRVLYSRIENLKDKDMRLVMDFGDESVRKSYTIPSGFMREFMVTKREEFLGGEANVKLHSGLDKHADYYINTLLKAMDSLKMIVDNPESYKFIVTITRDTKLNNSFRIALNNNYIDIRRVQGRELITYMHDNTVEYYETSMKNSMSIYTLVRSFLLGFSGDTLFKDEEIKRLV